MQNQESPEQFVTELITHMKEMIDMYERSIGYKINFESDAELNDGRVLITILRNNDA